MATKNVQNTVGDFVTLQRGNTYSGKLVGEFGPALLGLGSIEPGGGFRHDKYKTFGGECPPKIMLRPGDLYVALKGATKDGSMVGSIAKLPSTIPSGRLTQDTARLDFFDKNPEISNHLYWILRTPQYRQYCNGRVTGSASASFSREDFLSYPVPPITNTTRVLVNLFEAIETKMELNRRMNATLEAMARAIFKDWFVDFGPTRAKMGGRARYLASDIWALFPDRLDDERKPKGWLTKRWGELVSLEYGKSLTGYEGAAEPYPVFGTNGQIGFHSEPLCRHSGIIVGRKGAYRGVHYCDQPFFVIDTAFYVEPRDCAVELRWAYYEMLRIGLNDMDSGSAIPSTSRADFYSLPVLYPQFGVQQTFVQLLHPFWARQKQCDEECKPLATLRDALLPKLMSGEIHVREAAKIAEAAL